MPNFSFSKQRLFSLSVLIVGFTAITLQIVFLRELLIVFYGNEISISFMLAGWLVGGGIGGWFLGRVTDRMKNLVFSYFSTQTFLIFLCVVNIFVIRSLKIIWQITEGEMMGFVPMVFSSFIILVPTTFLLSFLFVLNCKIFERAHVKDKSNNEAISKVYLIEAMGSVIGGVLTSFIFIRFFSSFNIVLLVISLSFFNILLIASLSDSKEKRTRLIMSGLAGFLILVFLFLWPVFQKLDERSIARQWKNYNLLAVKNSFYGNIVVVGPANNEIQEKQASLFYNGFLHYTEPDLFSAEDAVHYALLMHPNPLKILIIGGGIEGLVREVLKYPVDKIDYLEIDPIAIKLYRDHLSSDRKILNNPKLNIKIIDGRTYVKFTKEKYDCIIMNIGNPYTVQLNRYYTQEFLKEAKTCMNANGILTFSLESSPNYIGDELARFLGSVYATLITVFEDVKIFPGGRARFFACNQKGTLTYDNKNIMAEAQKRNIKFKYAANYLMYDLTEERVDDLRQRLAEVVPRVKKNYDFIPISFYYDMILWTSHFQAPVIKKLLLKISVKKVWCSALITSFLVILFGLFLRYKNIPGRKFFPVRLAVFSTGFAEIVFQIIIILTFQVLYGCVFYKIGIILTAFMLGLVFGAWWINKKVKISRNYYQQFIYTQTGVFLYPLLLLLVFKIVSVNNTNYVNWLGSNFIFPALPVAAGFLGGVQFPLANKIQLEYYQETGHIAGLNYGLDLLGACLGAMIVSILLVPMLGVFQTCFLTAMGNLIVLIILWIER
jgi:spermidine synthase